MGWQLPIHPPNRSYIMIILIKTYTENYLNSWSAYSHLNDPVSYTIRLKSPIPVFLKVSPIWMNVGEVITHSQGQRGVNGVNYTPETPKQNKNSVIQHTHNPKKKKFEHNLLSWSWEKFYLIKYNILQLKKLCVLSTINFQVSVWVWGYYYLGPLFVSLRKVKVT